MNTKLGSLCRTIGLLLLLSLPLFAGSNGVVGAVYTMTNAATGNSVLVFDRLSDGTLQANGSVPTGGKGAGAPLASQGSMVLTSNNRWLLVSNAGSDNVTVFGAGNTLSPVGVFSSGGRYPYSIAVNGNLVYVLNAGLPAGPASNVTGFWMDNRGNLNEIAGSTRGLSAGFVDPAQVAFSPDGKFLMVTERGTNLIDVFPVEKDGTLGSRVSSPSAGAWPYGFAFGKRNQVFVSEANAMLPNLSSVSSYVLQDDGTLQAVSAASPTHLTAACWVVVDAGARYTYTTDALSKAVSGYSIDNSGAIELLNSDGRTATTSAGFAADAALSNDSRFLYVLTLLGSSVSAFRVEPDGSLTPVQALPIAGLPSGLAAR